MTRSPRGARMRRPNFKRSQRLALGRNQARQMLLETLEVRALLAADWQNPFYVRDVTDDGIVAPIDALIAINELNERTVIGEDGTLPPRAQHPDLPFWDVTGDGFLAPIDVLIVINALNEDDTPPAIQVGLFEDTGPGGVANQDLLTSNGTLSGRIVDDQTGIGGVRIQIDDQPEQVVRLAKDGSFTFDTALARDGSSEGVHRVRLHARDGLNNEAEPVDFSFTFDSQPPVVSHQLTGTLRRSFSVFDLRFNEPMSEASRVPASYTMHNLVGGEDGREVALVGAAEFGENRVFLEAEADLSDAPYRFSIRTAVTDLAGNVPVPARFEFTLADPAGIASVSPGNGTTHVGTTRETIVHFDEPIDPATLTPDAFYLIAMGERIAGRIAASSTERFATFFYDEPLPPSTAVRVVMDGNLIRGRDGRLLDADGDDEPGGLATSDFSTVALTRIPGTELFGYVYDAAHVIPQESAPIPVPAGDPLFDPLGTGSQTIAFKRAVVVPGTGTTVDNPRQFLNKVTSFIDASTVYGSDEFLALALRTLDGTGRLKTSEGNHLPLNNSETFPNGLVMMANEGPMPTSDMPVAGDVRAAEVPTLAAMHTLWVREHNRYVEQLKAANPRWTDDQLYDAGRRWVGALIQQITYQEFLPTLLGQEPLPAYTGYDPQVDPNISALFSTAAFRVGHTLQSGSIQRLGPDGESLPGGPLSIRNAFFNPYPLRNDGLDAYLRGMAAGRAQEFDLQVIDDLRNFLFGPPGAGGLDLVSINIQRGRDLGLPGYNQARVDRGLPRVTSFSQISSNPAVAAALEAVYGDVDKVDAWVGGVAEDPVNDGVVGALFTAIIKDQFLRSRDGDRFWFENGQFDEPTLAAIRATRLSDVIMRNTEITGLPANVFTVGAAHAGPGTGGGPGTPTETRSFDGYGNNPLDVHLGESNWPVRVDYTVSFSDGISSFAGADRPNPRAISNALSTQAGNTVNSKGLTDIAITWGQFLDHDLGLTPAQTVAGTNIPVVGATIRVDAFPEANAITDANGFFELENMPSPEFFVHIDGSTASNAPPGTQYPSVGKPFHTLPGQRTQLNMAGMPFNVYLPPMATADVTPLSATQPTEVGFGAVGLNQLGTMLPDVGVDEWQKLKVNFAPGSAVNEHGNAATQAAVIPVPPDRLPAPLPPGVDPRLVISIQTLGATNLDVPATITYPNLDNLPLGEHATLFSFDHDVGMFVPVGTLEVVDDGQGGTILVSDPGGGIVAPGWHYVTDPLNWGGAGGKPTGNKFGPAAPEISTTLDSTRAGRELKFEFAPPPGATKKVGEHQVPPVEPSRVVTITVEGPFADYYKPTQGGGVRTMPSFTLRPGDAKVTLTSVQKSLNELKADLNSNKLFEANILYGSRITVQEVLTLSDGTRQESVKIFFPYMLIDATDPEKEDLKLQFARVIADDAANEYRALPFQLRTGPSPAGLTISDRTHFFWASGLDQLWFDPVEAREAAWTSKLQVREPLQGKLAGEIDFTGIAVKKQGYKVDTVTFEDVASRVGNDNGTVFPNITATQRALLDNNPAPTPPALHERDAILASIKTQTNAYFSGAGASAGIFDAAALADDADNVVLVSFQACANPRNLGGAEGNALEPSDVDLAKIVAVYRNRAQYSQLERAYRIAEEINKELNGPVRFCFFNFFNNRPAFDTLDELKFAFGHNNAHEIGHHLGLFHTFGWRNNGTQVAGYDARPRTDVMSQGLFMTDTQTFDITKEALKFGLHIKWTGEDADKALAYYNAYQRAGGNFNALDEEDENSGPGLDLFPDPELGIFSQRFGTIATSVDLGSVVADGPGGAMLADVWTLLNLGPGELKLLRVAPSPGDSPISFSPDLDDVVLDETTMADLLLTFDPSTPGDFHREITFAADNGEEFTITVSARALAPTPDIRLALENNNCGGLELGSAATCSAQVTITNLGAEELIFTPSLVKGLVDFSLGAIEGAEQRLASEETLAIPITFHPSTLGLRPGMIHFTTNDPSRPLIEQGLVGTGIPVGGIGDDDFHWGNDYIRVRAGGVTHQLRSDEAGSFMAGLATRVEYAIWMFDPESGYLAKGGGTTGPSGAFNDITSPLRFAADTSPDSDFDGLPDDIEAAIGSATNRRDTDGDGLSDFFEIQQGLDPLGGARVPTGVIANLALPGQANSLAVAGDLVYVATGFHGLAIVDGTSFGNPILLGQLALAGNAMGIDVDPRLGIAAVALTSSLALVDIQDPMMPQLLRTVPVAAQRVVVHDGVAYAAVGSDVAVVDLNTGEVLQTLDLAAGYGGITGMAREGNRLYVYSGGDDFLRVLDISVHDHIRQLGQVFVPIASGDVGLHAGNGMVWLAGSGLNSVDVTDPERPVRIGQPSGQGFFSARRIAVNGSGLGVLATDFSNRIEVYDLSDPTVVDRKVLDFALPGPAIDVAISRGIAYVGHGSQLAVVNYLPFDNQGGPPTVTISSSAKDEDPGTAGLQVFEGTPIPIRVDAQDDVQLRQVELLVNGQRIATDVSFPFDFIFPAPNVPQGGVVPVVVRATDTGGNVTTSLPLNLAVVPDVFPPELVMVTPEDGSTRGSVFRTVRMTFSEPIDPATLTAETVRLVSLATPDRFVAPIDIQFRDLGQTVQFTYDQIPPGENQLTLTGAAIRDLAGNPLGADVIRRFAVLPATAIWINPAGGNWDDPANWDGNQLPGSADHVVIQVQANVTITHRSGETRIRSLSSVNAFTLSGGTLEVDDFIEISNTFTLAGGTLRNARLPQRNGLPSLIASANARVTLDHVTLENNLRVDDGAEITLLNGLALEGTITVANAGRSTTLHAVGTQSIGGTGRIVLTGTSGANRSQITTDAGETLTLGAELSVDANVGSRIGTNGILIIHATISGNHAGQTTTITGETVTNGGTFDARAGTLTSAAVTNFADGTLTGGVWRAGPGATLDIANTTISNNQAKIILDGPGAQFRSGQQNALAGLTTIGETGELQILGGNFLSTTTGVTNHGEVTLGAGSRWNVAGTFTQSENATLIIGIEGPNRSGALAATGAATLAGDLKLDIPIGVDPQLATFTPLTMTSRSGEFGEIRGAPPEIPFDREYRNQRVLLHFGATFAQTANLPFTATFNDGTLGAAAITRSNAAGRITVTSTNQPRSGDHHLVMDGAPGTTGLGVNEFIIPLSISGAGPIELAFYHKSFDTTADPLPATFLGSIGCDGVALSVDGLHWFRVVDLSTATSASYERFAFDLRAIAAAAGLTLTDHLLVKFLQLGAGAAPAGGRAFDDIRVGADVRGPSRLSLVPSGPFLFLDPVRELTATFDEPLLPATATDGSNFTLISLGGDDQFGTPDDRPIPLTPAFNGTDVIALSAAEPLSPGIFQLTFSGAASIRDLAGVPLLDGLDEVVFFAVFPPESPTNDSRDTATDTGIGTAGGTFRFRAAIGNQPAGGADVDLYRFSAEGGQFARATVTRIAVPGANNPLDLQVRILDSTGTELALGNGENADDAAVSVRLPGDGTYFVEVSSAAGNLGLYQLFVSSGGNIAEFPLIEDFEAGPPLAAFWETQSTTTGRVRVTDQSTALGGHFQLIADTNSPVAPWLLVHQNAPGPNFALVELGLIENVDYVVATPGRFAALSAAQLAEFDVIWVTSSPATDFGLRHDENEDTVSDLIEALAGVGTTGRAVLATLGADDLPAAGQELMFLRNALDWVRAGQTTGLVALHDTQFDWDWTPWFEALQGHLFDATGNDIERTAPAHEVLAGLTNTGLSNWSPSYHQFVDVDLPGFLTLAVDAGDATRRLALALDGAAEELPPEDRRPSQHEAILHVNLAGQPNVELRFEARLFDNQEPLSGVPNSFTGSVAGTGVSLSVDGTTWHNLFGSEGFVHELQFHDSRFTIDLDEFAAAQGLLLGEDVRIKFQYLGFGPAPHRGIALDNIEIVADRVGPEVEFVSPLDFLPRTRPIKVVAGDLNGDSIPDIVTANQGFGGAVSVFTNGPGGATESHFLPFFTGRDVLLADIDGDLALDLVVLANESLGSGVRLFVLRNDGQGGFGAPSEVTVSAGANVMAAGDLNSNGRTDLLIANGGPGGSPSASLLLNNGTGGFLAPIFVNVPLITRSLAIADLDGDGARDFVAVGTSFGNDSQLVAMRNTMSGGFPPFQLASATGVAEGSSSVMLDDLNGDGLLDAVTGGTNNSAMGLVSVRFGQPGGLFGGGADFAIDAGVSSVAVARINADEHSDIIAVTRDAQGRPFVTVLYNDGQGDFNPITKFPSRAEAGSIAIADLNGDSRPDVVTSSGPGNGGGNVQVLLTSAEGTLTAGVPRMMGSVEFPQGLATLERISIQFDETGLLDPQSLADAGNYELVEAGPDGLFDSPDDRALLLGNPNVVVSAVGEHSVRIAVAASELPLPAGRYQLTVKGTATIRDAEGNPLGDADGDGIGADYRTLFTILENGPVLMGTSPRDDLGLEASEIGLLFSELIDSDTFTLDDIRNFRRGTTMIEPLSVTVDGAQATVRFPLQTELGFYSFEVGPDIRDLAGNPMNSNFNALFGQPGDVGLVQFQITLSQFDESGFRYDWQNGNATLLDGGRDNGQQADIRTSSYNAAYLLAVGGAAYSGLTEAPQLEDAKRTLVFPSATLSGLDVQRKVYVPAAGGHFARLLDSFHNPTSSPIETTVTLSGNLGGAIPSVVASSSGDAILTPNDQWFATSSRLPELNADLAHVMQDGLGVVKLGAASFNDNALSFTWRFTITVAPGQTVRMLTFAIQADGAETAAAEAADLASLPPRAIVNLSAEELATLINFQVPSALRLRDAARPVCVGAGCELGLETVESLRRALLDAWTATGRDLEVPAILRNLQFQIIDLPGNLLGAAFADQGLVFLDRDAAGHGWFLPRSPEDDASAASQPGDDTLLSPAARVDLLTVLAHELSHLLGRRHSDDADDLMHESLLPGERRLDWAQLVDQLFFDE